MLLALFLASGCFNDDGTNVDTQTAALDGDHGNDEEAMCKPLGAHCFDPEQNPHAAACCDDPETAGCFRGRCTEATVNPPGCVQQGDPCSPGVDTCCSAGRFDPLGVCEDPFGEGFVCDPPA